MTAAAFDKNAIQVTREESKMKLQL